MNVLLISPEFPVTFWSFKYALEFVNKKACNPPLGLITVAAMLPKDWQKKLIDVNVTPLTDKDFFWADMIFISAMNIQQKSAKEIIAHCKELGKTVVAGGPLFTSEPENYPEVDHLILNEAELTLPPFLNDLNLGKPKKVYATKEFADLSLTPPPMWELLDFSGYDCMDMQLSRGCPFNCDFCDITALLGHRPRLKSAQQLITELDQLYALGWRRNIFLVDDNLIGNKKALKQEILPALIKWREGKDGCYFITEVSINLADDDELCDLMVKAGFVSVFVGIETPSDESLIECNKTQNRNRGIMESVHHLLNKGIQVMAGFIVGFDSDPDDIFDRQIEFIQQSGIVTAMVGLLQAPYGTKLYDRLKDQNRIIEELSGDNADGNTNIIPKMDLGQLQDGYFRILDQIYSPKNFYKRVNVFLDHYEPRKDPVHIQLEEVAALFKTIYRLGIIGVERKEYWKLFFGTLFTRPAKFPMAITLTVYGYHFRLLSEKVVRAHVNSTQPTSASGKKTNQPLSSASPA
jgi:radical SAM superfamily enzyme YgiQ (UPF0313 family)